MAIFGQNRNTIQEAIDGSDEELDHTTKNSKSEDILDIQPSHSAKHHLPGRWNRRLVGLSIPSCKDFTRTAWKTELSTDVSQAKVEARYGQRLTELTLHKNMGLLR